MCEQEHRSTLERGDEIERDFYRLKAQEWACEPEAARKRIEAAVSRPAPTPTEAQIDNWHDKPIEELSREELVDALTWSVNRQRDLLRELSDPILDWPREAQFKIATRIAANVGYVLAPEPLLAHDEVKS